VSGGGAERFSRVDDGFTETRGRGLDGAAAGQQSIVALVERTHRPRRMA
jgi:hypothetical protein